MTADARDMGAEDEMVEAIVDEIENAVEDYADEHRASQAAVDTALFTCAVQHGVDAGLEKEHFLAMLEEMFEESREMGELAGKMSLTRGEA